jgi:hypothetical protein
LNLKTGVIAHVKEESVASQSNIALDILHLGRKQLDGSWVIWNDQIETAKSI